MGSYMRKEMPERLLCTQLCQRKFRGNENGGRARAKSYNQQSVCLIFPSVHIG